VFLAFLSHDLTADLKCLAEGEAFDLTFGGKTRTYRARSLVFDPSRAKAQIGLVTPSTLITFEELSKDAKVETIAPVDPVEAYSQVGGLSTQIQQIRELVELPFTRPEIYKHFGRSRDQAQSNADAKQAYNHRRASSSTVRLELARHS
jgi:AAA family ATPase